MDEPSNLRESLRLERRQNRWRLAFIVFVLAIVYAQGYQGRVFQRGDLVRECNRAQAAYHELRLKPLYIDCKKEYGLPHPWPW